MSARDKQENDKNATALFKAVESGTPNEVNQLLDQEGAQVDQKNDRGETPLFLAVRKKHREMAQLLLNNGASVATARTLITEEKNVPHPAETLKFLETMQQEVFVGHLAKGRPNLSGYMLFEAAKEKDSKLVRKWLTLLQETAPTMDYPTEVKAVKWAMHSRPPKPEVRDFLINEKYEKPQALIQAAKRGNIEEVKTLLEQGVLCNRKGGHDDTPLFVASSNGHADVVNLLLEAGAPVNQAAGYGASPLFFASRNGYAGIVTQLLAKGALVDQEREINGNADTPIYIALRQGHIEIARYLLEYGANVSKTRAIIRRSNEDKPKLFECLRAAKERASKDLILLRKRLPEYTEELVTAKRKGNKKNEAKYKGKVAVCGEFIKFLAVRNSPIIGHVRETLERYDAAKKALSRYLYSPVTTALLKSWKGSDLNKVAKNLMKLVSECHAEVEEKAATSDSSGGGGGSKEKVARSAVMPMPSRERGARKAKPQPQQSAAVETRPTSPVSVFVPSDDRETEMQDLKPK